MANYRVCLIGSGADVHSIDMVEIGQLIQEVHARLGTHGPAESEEHLRCQLEDGTGPVALNAYARLPWLADGGDAAFAGVLRALVGTALQGSARGCWMTQCNELREKYAAVLDEPEQFALYCREMRVMYPPPPLSAGTVSADSTSPGRTRLPGRWQGFLGWALLAVALVALASHLGSRGAGVAGAARALLGGLQSRPVQHLPDAFSAVDVDQDGAIDASEFAAAARSFQPPLSRAEVRHSFHLLDSDKDGRLGPKELAGQGLAAKPEHRHPARPTRVAGGAGTGMWRRPGEPATTSAAPPPQAARGAAQWREPNTAFLPPTTTAVAIVTSFESAARAAVGAMAAHSSSTTTTSVAPPTTTTATTTNTSTNAPTTKTAISSTWTLTSTSTTTLTTTPSSTTTTATATTASATVTATTATASITTTTTTSMSAMPIPRFGFRGSMMRDASILAGGGSLSILVLRLLCVALAPMPAWLRRCIQLCQVDLGVDKSYERVEPRTGPSGEDVREAFVRIPLRAVKSGPSIATDLPDVASPQSLSPVPVLGGLLPSSALVPALDEPQGRDMDP